jgi:NAD-dependent dihydropyrimidine dehydrogenase PreA subunit
MEHYPWNVRLIKKIFHNRFRLVKLTKYPILGKIIDAIMFKGDRLVFLPKDQIFQEHQSIIEINQEIGPLEQFALPSKILRYFIEKASVRVKMNFCLCRYSNDCKDYPIELGCLFLGKTALKIKPELGEKVSIEAALHHLEECEEKGLIHLIARSKLDSIWLDAKPQDNLLTICNCCPCCCNWRMVPYFKGKKGFEIADRIHRVPGIEFQVTDICTGCGSCIENRCIVDAIEIIDGHAKIKDHCIGCGRCASVCPQQAIKMLINDAEFIEKTVERISSVVDVE